MTRITCWGLWLCGVLACATVVQAADPLPANPTEADYYPITRFEVPKDVVLEAGAFCLMPDGKLAVSSRRGEVWMVTDPFA